GNCGDIIYPGELYEIVDGKIYHTNCAPKQQKRIKRESFKYIER
ncbi:unnamed protein product, partial [marine sediment metagenome]